MTSFHSRKLCFPFHGSIDVATMNRRIRTSYSPIASPLPSVIPRSFPWFSRPLLDGEHDNLNLASIIIIGLGSTACVIMFLITLSKILKIYYLNRYNVSRRNPPILFDVRGDSPPFSDDEEHSIRFSPTEGLQQSTIDSITVYRYRNNQVLVKETECLVCLGEFQQEESLRLLPKCSHAFHVPCIDTWLRSHKTCPLCRTPIVHDAVSVDGETESDSSVSDIIHDMEECDGSGVVRVGDGIEILSEFGEVNGDSSAPISRASDADTQTQEFDDENDRPRFSVDSYVLFLQYTKLRQTKIGD
ncbi:hypothetical protein V8G54_020212 [Vigna mungo]|uniref:RING-type E3 ubiquitin transferase n=1 Tax=Vigna mungo TaxID=3915 RepID=A0AAQ3NC55_VIGMU